MGIKEDNTKELAEIWSKQAWEITKGLFGNGLGQLSIKKVILKVERTRKVKEIK